MDIERGGGGEENEEDACWGGVNMRSSEDIYRDRRKVSQIQKTVHKHFYVHLYVHLYFHTSKQSLDAQLMKLVFHIAKQTRFRILIG